MADDGRQIEEVVQAMSRSRRYRTLYEPIVRRLASEALRTSRGKHKEAVKRVKRSLHQIFGAFLPQRPRYDRLLEELADLDPHGEAFRDRLWKIAGQHASTRERLPFVEELYTEIFTRLGEPPSSLLDLGCGLNALTIPWTKLPPDVRYAGIEIDRDLVEFLQRVLDLLGIRHDLRVADVLTCGGLPESEVALLLKLLPTLEQQSAGGSRSLLQRLPADRLVVSFPVLSLGRRAKGMKDTYAGFFEDLLQQEGWSWEVLDVSHELVYMVTRGTP